MYYAGMSAINHHHLRYFWTVAREGSVAGACRRLHVTQPTISAQIRLLERSLGHKLFTKRGRGLALTESGRTVMRFADDIFSVEAEMRGVLAGQPTGEPLRLAVGIADVLPKLVAYRLLMPALQLPGGVRLSCSEGKPADLCARLSVHDLDVVLSDAPLTQQFNFKGYSHLLGQSSVTFFGAGKLGAARQRGFPKSLHGAPMLLPAKTSAVRFALDAWFEAKEIIPRVVAEIEDAALMKVFGQSGLGLFPAPTAIEEEITRQFHVKAIGRIAEIKDSFYAISPERRFKHPAVVAIARAARRDLFS